MSSFFRFAQRYPVFKFLPIQILGIIVSTHFNFSLIPLYVLFGLFFLLQFSRFFQIALPIIVLLMPILVMETGNSQNIPELPSGEIVLRAAVVDIQKKRNSEHIILDAEERRILLKTTDTLNISPNDTLVIRGKLKNPDPPRNPGQFDYGAYL